MYEIDDITARIILDSRGEKTIEAMVRLSDGSVASASVPQGKSRGSGEATYVSVEQAMINIKELVLPALKNSLSIMQKEIDGRLKILDGTANKERLGANTILAVSIAVARAAANARGIPLWAHLREMAGVPILEASHPRLFVNLINGGEHAKNKLAFQEYLAIIDGANFTEMIEIQASLWSNLKKMFNDQYGDALPLGDEGGFAPEISDNLEPFRLIKLAAGELIEDGFVSMGTDVAGVNAKLTVEERDKLFETAMKEYGLIYIEDPYEENDFASFAKMKALYGDKLIVTGDDLTVTNSELMRTAERNKSINGVIIKPNQIGSVSEAMEAVRTANSFGWKVIASHRSGETEDTFIADFAYAVGAFGLKLGVPTQAVRHVKYDRLLEIDKEVSGI
ncbi:MAG: Enolase [Parcubacteria group bacterium LiPW_30]|nr:MAG: Enolase [Parcubacteria group bacterium LiPW_30]